MVVQSRVDAYRSRAGADRRAQVAKDLEARHTFQGVARKWRELAAQVEREERLRLVEDGAGLIIRDGCGRRAPPARQLKAAGRWGWPRR